MGVGKSSTCHSLKRLLPRCVFLDGDWCWDMSPFTVTEETKAMALDNIAYLLNSFLACSEFDHVLFCWVMQEQAIVDEVLRRLPINGYRLYSYSLVCSEQALRDRLERDIAAARRSGDIVERSLDRLSCYKSMDTQKIDVSARTAEDAARLIYAGVCGDRPPL